MSFSPNRKRSPEQWQQLVEAQAASGQTQVAFCAEHGLSKSSFQLWKRRLYAASPAGHPDSPSTALFTPLTEPPIAAASDGGWTIELDLGDGVCLRLRRSG